MQSLPNVSISKMSLPETKQNQYTQLKHEQDKTCSENDKYRKPVVFSTQALQTPYNARFLQNCSPKTAVILCGMRKEAHNQNWKLS